MAFPVGYGHGYRSNMIDTLQRTLIVGRCRPIVNLWVVPFRILRPRCSFDRDIAVELETWLWSGIFRQPLPVDGRNPVLCNVASNYRGSETSVLVSTYGV